MLDSGAGLNTIPEEVVLDVINSCEQAGVNMSDERHPIVELQRWPNEEKCSGVAGGATVPMVGAVILVLTFVDRNTGDLKAIEAHFKILAAGKTDWVPIILGGMAIDSPDRGGLGVQPRKNSFYLTKLQMLSLIHI